MISIATACTSWSSTKASTAPGSPAPTSPYSLRSSSLGRGLSALSQVNDEKWNMEEEEEAERAWWQMLMLGVPLQYFHHLKSGIHQQAVSVGAGPTVEMDTSSYFQK